MIKMDLQLFMDVMENFSEIHKTLNIDIPKEFKPFLELYGQVLDENLDTIQKMMDNDVDLKSLERFEKSNQYLVHTEKASSGYTMNLIIVLPAVILSDYDSSIGAYFDTVIDYVGVAGIETSILEGVFQKDSFKIFRDIAIHNGVLVEENAFDMFNGLDLNITVIEEPDVDPVTGLEPSEEVKQVKTIYRYRLVKRITSSVMKADALVEAKDTFKRWLELKEELAYGFGA